MLSERTITERITAALPGATVRETRQGFEVGGFSYPPVVAQRLLREAGLTARDCWGATIVDSHDCDICHEPITAEERFLDDGGEIVHTQCWRAWFGRNFGRESLS